MWVTYVGVALSRVHGRHKLIVLAAKGKRQLLSHAGSDGGRTKVSMYVCIY